MEIFLLLLWLFGQGKGSTAPPSFPSPQPIPPGPIPVPVPAAPPPVAQPPAAAATYVIKAGDTPFGLAKRFTGQGSRFKELLPPNPELKVVDTRDDNGTIIATHYVPFNPGQVLKLPPTWPPTAPA
jgi:nucleoid-associated protein YgaU